MNKDLSEFIERGRIKKESFKRYIKWENKKASDSVNRLINAKLQKNEMRN